MFAPIVNVRSLKKLKVVVPKAANGRRTGFWREIAPDVKLVEVWIARMSAAKEASVAIVKGCPVLLADDRKGKIPISIVNPGPE